MAAPLRPGSRSLRQRRAPGRAVRPGVPAPGGRSESAVAVLQQAVLAQEPLRSIGAAGGVLQGANLPLFQRGLGPHVQHAPLEQRLPTTTKRTA